MSCKQTHIGEFVASGQIHIQTGPFGTQLGASDYTSEGTPVINVRNIGYGNLRPDKLEYIPDSVVKRLKKHVLEQNDIVFGRKGAVDRHLLVSDEQAGWVQGSDCIRLRVLSGSINPIFLSFVLRLDNHKQWMLSQCSNKATMASLNQGVINRIPICVPDRATQKSIVFILKSYDDLIENNRRRIQLLEEAARLLYREWFVHLRFPGHEHVAIKDGVPEGWERRTLGDLCKEIRETVKPEALEPDTPYIGLEHMPRRSISLGEWGTAEQITSSKHRFHEGDILFGKIRPYFHKVGIAFVDGIASSDTIVIRPCEHDLRNFVLMTVSSDPFVAVTAQTMREGSKMPRADWKQMQAYLTPLPPSGLLDNFDRSIQAIIEQLKSLSLTNQKLAQARDLLLPRLMNGEIIV
jgi:type I restriction enzyme S subunit